MFSFISPTQSSESSRLYRITPADTRWLFSSGWASQWYRSSFTAPIRFDGSDEHTLFPTAEHWMMLQKALLFSDFTIAREIIAVSGTSRADMTYIKALGRKVANFTDEEWIAERKRLVLEGNLLKFRQNPELREKLIATGEKKLAEASPRDRIWGIGFGEKNAMARKDEWGLNLLGEILEETREILKQDGQEI